MCKVFIEDSTAMKEEKPKDREDREEWVTLDDILTAMPKYKARCIILKINVFVIGWVTSSANVFLIMNSLFHSHLPDYLDTHKTPYIALLLFLSTSEVIGFFQGLLLVYGSDVSSPQHIRDSMILAMFTTASYWISLLTIFLTGLPVELAAQPLIMTAFTLLSLFFSNSYYYVLETVVLGNAEPKI